MRSVYCFVFFVSIALLAVSDLASGLREPAVVASAPAPEHDPAKELSSASAADGAYQEERRRPLTFFHEDWYELMVERLLTWMKAANPEFGRTDSKLQMAKRSMMGGQPKQIYQDMLTYNTIQGLRSKKFDVRSKRALHVFSTDFRDIALRRLHKKMPGPKLMIHDLQDLEQYEFYEGSAMHRLLRTVLGAKEVAILAMLATRQLEGEPLRIARMVQRVQFDSWYNHKIRPKTVKQAFEKGWEIRSTSSPGKAKSGPAQPGDSTYANDIARAFQKRCAELGQQRYHFFEH